MTDKEKKRENEKINNKAVQVIIETIKDMIHKTMDFERKNMEITYRGHITDILSDYVYKVNIQGTSITVPCATDQTFSKGDAVLVLYPQGKSSNSYIIGKARSRIE